MIILTHFFFGQEAEYGRLFSVFEKSAKATMPGVPVVLINSPLPDLPIKPQEKMRDTRYKHHAYTAQAFLDTVDWIINLATTSDFPINIAVCDVDMLFLRGITDVWNYDFDIAYTTRDFRAPLNTGIWFYRFSEQAFHFLLAWKRYTQQVLTSFYHGKMKFIDKFAGIDQASLYATIKWNKNKKDNIKLLTLPCHIWNCTQSELHIINEMTRVIHLKSLFRTALFGDVTTIPENKLKRMQPYIDMWKQYESGDNNG